MPSQAGDKAMSNSVFNNLLNYIQNDNIEDILNYDNINDKNDIMAFLNASETSTYLTSPIIGHSIISDGNFYTTLKIINDISLLHGEFTLCIGGVNQAINMYLIKRANEIYERLNIDVKIAIDYDFSLNKYKDNYVTIIGREKFVLSLKEKCLYSNYIIIM